MFEAVGESYFAGVARNLKSGGRAFIQTIVIDEALFECYRKGTDFIPKYSFPDGRLPSPKVFKQYAEQYGLRVINQFKLGRDYARTLDAWRSAPKEQLPEGRPQGFGDHFLCAWAFYLAYCAAGFCAGSIDLAQFIIEKP